MYVGPVERERYDVRTFADREGTSIAYEAPAATVYRVDTAALNATAARYDGGFTNSA